MLHIICIYTRAAWIATFCQLVLKDTKISDFTFSYNQNLSIGDPFYMLNGV